LEAFGPWIDQLLPSAVRAYFQRSFTLTGSISNGSPAKFSFVSRRLRDTTRDSRTSWLTVATRSQNDVDPLHVGLQDVSVLSTYRYRARRWYWRLNQFRV